MLVVCHQLTNDGTNIGNSHLHNLLPNVKYFNETTNRTSSNISTIDTVL